MDTGRDEWRAKVLWSEDEDAELRRLVEKHGARNWTEIAAGIPGRSGKSCRLRWCNQLNPDVNHQPFTPEEDEVIVRLHAEHGNKWSAIAKFLPGRSDNAIKNHYNSTLQRFKRRRIGASESDSVINRNSEIGEGVSSVTRVRGSEDLETALSLMPPGSLAEEEFGAPSNMIQRSGHHSNDNNSCRYQPFTPEEDKVILSLHAENGNNWTAIARLLPGRSDNAIKNHFNSTLWRFQRRRIGASESGSVRNRNCEVGEGVSSVTPVHGSEGLETALSLMPPGSLAEEEFSAPSNMIQRGDLYEEIEEDNSR